MKDTKNNTGAVLLLEPADLVATDTVSGILDTANFNGAILSVIVGALTGVDGSNYLTPVFQESDTLVGTSFATVAATDLVGAFSVVNATSKDSVVQSAGYIGNKRYIRVNLDYTGTGISAGIVGVVGILNEAKFEPVTAPAVLAAT